MENHLTGYLKKISIAFENNEARKNIELLAKCLLDAWDKKKTVFICGNGGSAGNAIHLANDFNYGVDKANGIGLRVDALPSNQSIITCLANDEGYEKIYSQQLRVKAEKDDILIVLSGSGNSPNIIKALEVANELEMKTFAILGFSGGKCKSLAMFPIHFSIDDMQVSEDLQMIVGHVCMQWMSELRNNKLV
jgi:D-sedoheptulose 7-phosphate isomerase